MKRRIITSVLLISLFMFLPVSALAQSTSPKKNAAAKEAKKAVPEDAITFSEFPKGTSITDQYRDKGIIFGGSDPFITSDGANPTSPVLSGSPRFQGEITGKFVEPGTDESTVVQSFTLDAGYFDADGSTRISWFGPDGEKLGQRTNSEFGIQRFKIEGGGIARWEIEIIEIEPAGYAIDNVSIESAGSSILFREKEAGKKSGTWDLGDYIPGFDHTALHHGDENLVYESHPGYTGQTYVSEDGEVTRSIKNIDGVQSQHALSTFKHDNTVPEESPVIDYKRIPIDENLADKMRTEIQSVSEASFQGIDYDNLEETLAPEVQKGKGGDFTCVGLIEWAAEQAGLNGGEGFIKNELESIPVPDLENFEIDQFPTLSPMLLNWTLEGANLIRNSQQYVQAVLDPVDFVITDPLGRKLGYVQGEKFNEIPGAFYNGNGDVEQLFIPNAIPGRYEIEFVGTGENATAAFSASGSEAGLNRSLAAGESATKEMSVDPKTGSRGDVDRDGDVDEDDIEELKSKITRFTDGLDNPGDLNGDGKLSDKDVSLLTDLVGAGESGNATGQVFYPIEGQGSLQAGRPLEGLEVEVRSEEGDVLGTATTGEDGSYQLELPAGGPYEARVDPGSVGQNLGAAGQNVDVFDLVRAVQALFGFDPLVGPFQEQVADVDGTGGLQSPDLYQIVRFINGEIGGFEPGPWTVGTEEGIEVESNGAVTGVDLEVAERGDVDLSGGAAPKDGQSGGEALALATTRSGTAPLQPGETAEVPVRLEGGATVGAYAFALEVPSEKIELQGVEAPPGTPEAPGPEASLEEGTLTVGWAAVEAPPLEVGDGEALAVLKVAVPEGTEGSLELEASRAAAVGPEGAPLEGATLAVPGLEAGPERPEEFALKGSRPNPASGPARIVVDLPERAAVTVEVYNTLGQRVLEVRETMAGGRGQALQLDGSGLSSGQYFYRVRAELGGETVRETGRLTVVR